MSKSGLPTDAYCLIPKAKCYFTAII